jgi:hypothetical protein
MWDKSWKKLKFFRHLAGGFALFLLSPLALAVNQNEAYLQADQQNRSASDTSLKHSTVYAMNALMDLGNLNIKSAVNNGMTAYGKYRNSETLDKLGDINYNQAGALSSTGSSAPARKTDTTFRRLDPSFLRQGEYAQVAAAFEQKSGMRRDQFLGQLAEASENKIHRSDPNLVGKVIGRFESFISKVPNKDFRNNLQKGVNMVPEGMRSGLISKAVSKFANGMAALGLGEGAAAPSSAPAAAAKPEATASAGEAPAAPAAASASEADGSLAAAADPAGLGRVPAAESASGAEAANPLGNIVQAALDTQEQDPTLFQIITRRYRTLTPELTTH